MSLSAAAVIFITGGGAASAQDCDVGALRLLTNFEGASVSDCARDGNDFVVRIAPESVPINPSAWYAFDIVADQPQSVTVRLEYADGFHRYVPKVEALYLAGENDLPIIGVEDVAAAAVLTFDMPQGHVRISAQPLVLPFAHRQWALDFAGRTPFSYSVEGRSRDARDIWHLRLAAPGSDLSVLLLGGQHPPEVPGAFAMRDFLERVAENDALATRFRERFHIDAFPMLNPDGIARGHWRNTAGLADLNRDWGVFTQAESRIVANVLARQNARGIAPVLMIDFHATRVGDVLYVPDSAIEGVEPFLSNWIARIDAIMSGEGNFEGITGNNPGLPTARSWFTRTFTAPGVTLEIHDETSRDHTRRLARAAAQAMMAQLLDQYPNPEQH